VHGSARWLDAAARRIRRFLASSNGGRLPTSSGEWTELCESLGVPAGPLSREHAGFTARLFRDDRLGGWLIVYRLNASESEVCRFLCHEISEWLAVINYPCLFDGLPRRVYCYTGGDDPQDARHKIAKRVEQLCFRK
jgi:hypothetical protein